MEFQDQVAIVTGASQGIGFGISNKLAQEGAKVYLVARTESKLQTAKEKIESTGGKVEIFPADITNMDQMKQVIDKLDVIKSEIDYIKEHMFDPDTVMTTEEGKRFEQSVKELKEGRVSSPPEGRGGRARRPTSPARKPIRSTAGGASDPPVRPCRRTRCAKTAGHRDSH